MKQKFTEKYWIIINENKFFKSSKTDWNKKLSSFFTSISCNSNMVALFENEMQSSMVSVQTSSIY